MRHEHVGKTKATITGVESHNIGVGAKETRQGLRLTVKLKKPNTILADFHPLLRGIYYEKQGSAAKEQKQLDGIDPVTDLPQLTELGSKLGKITWPDEQSGSTLTVYRGIRDDAAFRLKDGLAHKFRLTMNDGGTVEEEFSFDVADLDSETAGELLLMVGSETDIELAAPEVVQEELPAEKPKKVRQTPAQALGAALGLDGDGVTTH
jgi:hypothetical protein